MVKERVVFVGAKGSQQACKLAQWKVKPGDQVSMGKILLHYCNAGEDKHEKLRANKVGTVTTLLLKEGDSIKPGDEVLELELCSHPTVMRDLCAECGADLSDEKQQTASVPMVHSVPELKVSIERAKQLGRVDEERLLRDRKLVLLVDLDQTLIHTTNDDVPVNLKDVHHFQLYGANSPWYHTRLRPGTAKFLEKVFKWYELHICTFGARLYAHTIAKMLDRDERLFSHRILSRDECFDPHSKTANLSALFPCGDHMVCIIDDREDVWNFAPNVVAVKPYHFFQHTGDINAPPGLDKHEQDGSGCVPESLIEKPEKPADEVKASATNEKTEIVKQKEENPEEKVEKKETPEEKAEQNEETPEQKAERKETPEEKVERKEESHEKKVEQKVDSLKEKADENLDKKEVEKEGDKSLESKAKENIKRKEEDLIEINDPDDYLSYLEEILERIHTAYYKEYDETGEVPVMRYVIPKIRTKVLAGQKLVFSGVVPTHVSVNNSRYAQLARKLGATVAEQIVPGETTHLVAARHGTAKVNEARRAGICIVSPEWLMCCSERWERVDERVFPLTKSSKRGVLSERHLRLSANLAESCNPLFVLSSDDLKSMDKEVDDICNETDDESAMDRVTDTDDQDSAGEELMKNSSSFAADLETDDDDDESQDAPKAVKRQHEENVESKEPPIKVNNFDKFNALRESSDSADSENSDGESGNELNEMGLALEREFLLD
ncbi:Hypothetical predicted protein [Cloeon dipterum]|uniref:RNA polymerase II subunit A C-terminal domain phosphatase n=1 Tax=Cloeon dipterum TaxID=197152 RepID=A0A8S1D858_9INSE|nr:Hypothetical predicted protein [Cloeon dipterum]